MLDGTVCKAYPTAILSFFRFVESAGDPLLGSHRPLCHHAVLGHDAQEVGACGITRQVNHSRVVVHLHHVQHTA